MNFSFRHGFAISPLAAVLAAVLVAAVPSFAAVPGPVVRLQSGRVRGITRAGLRIFQGIPYAQPPVGPLRWRPPQQVRAWSGIRPATQFGHDCMQLPTPGDAAPLRTRPSEDCLYLNVWAPPPAPRPLPVLVWIYGGGFVNGGSSPAVYSGARFARDGIVFVSFNYRLARFGFFAFPALDRQGGPVGNYGFMDQIAALRWVQRNIAAFGGDPKRVTICGESAGGMSVNMLLTSPRARGLFAAAIIESGGGRDNLLPPPPLNHPGPAGQPSAEMDGVAFARKMGIHGTGAPALAALRRLPARDIVDGINMASMAAQRAIYSGPMVDGQVVVEPGEAVFKAGRETRVPLIVGANSLDLGFSHATTLAAVFRPFGPHRAQARRAFDPTGRLPVRAVAYEVAAVEDMLEPARFVARSMARTGEPAYQYRFSYVAHALRGRLPGAPHSSEIPYVFATLRRSMWSGFGRGITAQDLRMAREAHAYWVHFVKTGNPNGPGLPHWPVMTPGGNQLLNFTAAGPKPETDPWAERLDLVQPLQP